MRNIIEKQCEESFPKFMERAANISWQERSVLLSEAFAFCAIGDLFDIDIVMESGIYLGRSTEIWANYFPDKPIYAVDCKLRKEAKERLQKYGNIILMEGDGPLVLDSLLEKLKDKKIGIFMDGPKGKVAIDWGKEALNQQDVKFFALHDLSMRKKGVRSYFMELRKETFFTDAKWFVNSYAKLDGNECRWDETQGFKWIPYKYISKNGPLHHRYLESYGPTIGFAFNSKEPEYEIEVSFPEKVQKYIDLQCNNKKNDFLQLSEIKGIEKYLKDLNPKIALDMGSGIGRASVFFFKYFNWKNTLFILADGDSGDKQLSGMRAEGPDFYNSLNATELFCKSNGMENIETFNIEKCKWEDLSYRPDLVYSFLALGFHWPINSFLEDIYPFLKNNCLLIFGLRGGTKAKDWISQQIEKIDSSKYQIIEFYSESEMKRGDFMVLKKKE